VGASPRRLPVTLYGRPSGRDRRTLSDDHARPSSRSRESRVPAEYALSTKRGVSYRPLRTDHPVELTEFVAFGMISHPAQS